MDRSHRRMVNLDQEVFSMIRSKSLPKESINGYLRRMFGLPKLKKGPSSWRNWKKVPVTSNE